MKEIVELREIIEKKIKDLNYPTSPSSLYDPIRYVLSLPAKRIRPVLLLLSHQMFDDDLEEALFPAIAIEVFHNFTLLHDDIMDNAPLRRGKQTVHERWGENVAILSGDVMMIHAHQLLAQTKSKKIKEVFSVFAEAAVKVCEGQQLDMDFEHKATPTLLEYMKMIEYKTAVLLAASLKIGAIIGGANKETQDHLYKFGINIGIAFQLKDDFLDIYGNPESFGKQVGGDVLSNKKTFLYLKALQLADKANKNRLQAHYKTTEKSQNKINAVKEIFKNLNLRKHTLEMMRSYYIKATKHLEYIDSSKKTPLVCFSNELMQRIS